MDMSEMHDIIHNALYVMDDDLKDGSMLIEYAKKSKTLGMDACMKSYAMKAKRRIHEDYDESKNLLMNAITKLKSSGVADAPDSIQGHLWTASMLRYDSWRERLKSELKELGY